MMHTLVYIYCFIALGKSWDLSDFGVSENYYVSSIAIYRTRAFLALPRSVCFNNISNPTLIEVAWAGNLKQTAMLIKNSVRSKILEHQQWGQCKDLQDVMSLDFEPKTLKLWILDKGNEICPAKIVSYSILFNGISESVELINIERQNLNIFTIDPEFSDAFGYRAYIGGSGDNTLLVFSLDELKWWKVNLIEADNPGMTVNTDYMAISKTDPILYLTGKDTLELFSLDLEIIRNSMQALDDDVFVNNVTLIGQKLGISRGLETDFKSGLSYYMVRDYVVLRWISGLPLQAEYHNVLAQSYEKLPFVSQLFTGPQNGLWALVNPLSPDSCIEINNTIAENIPKPESRFVKILKYNKFLNDKF